MQDEKVPVSTGRYVAQAEEAVENGDFTNAEALYTLAIEMDPGNVSLHCDRSFAYLKLGKYEEAERDASVVLSSSSSAGVQGVQAQAYYRRAMARRSIGGAEKLTGAVADFEQAERLMPKNTEVKAELVQARELLSVQTLSVSELREKVLARGGSVVGCVEKRDLLSRAETLIKSGAPVRPAAEAATTNGKNASAAAPTTYGHSIPQPPPVSMASMGPPASSSSPFPPSISAPGAVSVFDMVVRGPLWENDDDDGGEC